MKKNIHIFVFLSIFVSCWAYAETLTLRTYYPVPFGNYERLRLVPRARLSNPCPIGTMYTETPDVMRYCTDDGTGTGAWGALPGVWRESPLFDRDGDGIDDVDVFLTSFDNLSPGDPNLFVGIGTSNPQSQLHIQTTSSPSINWGSSGDLNGDLIIAGSDPTITLIGEDASSSESVIKMPEVDSAGNYQNLWALGRNATSSSLAGEFYISYMTPAMVPDWNYWSNAAGRRLTIKTTGEVGIGTASPTGILHVVGDDVRFEDISPSIAFINSDVDPNWRIKASNSLGGLAFESDVDQDGIYENTRVLFNPTNGKIGIGTTAPATQLHLSGTNADRGGEITLESDGSVGITFDDTTETTDYWIKSSGKQLRFYSKEGGNPQNIRMAIKDNGWIGIGTTNPDTVLEVVTDNNTDLFKLTSTDSTEILFEAQTSSGSAINNRISTWDGNMSFSYYDSGSTDWNTNMQIVGPGNGVSNPGDVYLPQVGSRLIMMSPDGSCSACGPNDSDAWVCTGLLACP